MEPSLDLGSDPDPQPETEYISFVWKVGPAPEITEITEKYGNPYFFLITEFLGAELWKILQRRGRKNFAPLGPQARNFQILDYNGSREEKKQARKIYNERPFFAFLKIFKN